MIAAIEAWKNGLFKKDHWLKNIVSGCIVGIVALPLAMAFAIASGMKPEQGIYTAIIAGFIVSIFGGSRVQIAGPTGAFIVILAGIVEQHGVLGLQVATMLAGGMLLGLGLMKFGNFIKFIPDPVIVGFTSGIGVLIWVSQWQSFLGLPKVSGAHFHEKLMHLLALIPQAHIPTTLLAIFSLIILIGIPKIPGLRRVPSPLFALVICTLLQATFQWKGIATIGSQFGGIPQGLPSFQLMSVSFDEVLSLIGPAFTITMLGAIESLLSAVVADGMAGSKHDSNQELIGQGIANIIIPLFGGFAATGAIARTATNIRYGGNSPLAGIIHSITLLIIIIFLAPMAVYIPLCVLAAILFVVAYNMSEVKHFIHIVKFAPKSDIFILLNTFILTIFTDLVVAVNIGIVLAMLHFVGRMSSTAEVRTISGDELTHKLQHQEIPEIPSELLIYSIQGPFFFGAIEKFKSILAATHMEPKAILIRLGHVPFMDITGLEMLERTITDLQKQNITILISEANERVYNNLKRVGILEQVGAGYFQDFYSALSHSNDLLTNSK